MIRVNLLPGAKIRGAQSASASTQNWFLAYAVVAVIWLILLAVNYVGLSDRVAEKQKQNATIQADIQRIQKQTRELDAMRAKLTASQELQKTVSELNRARVGPTRVMVELSRILSPGGGPTIDPEKLEAMRRDNPLAGFNKDWDPKRLWMEHFVENERACTIEGKGKTNEDVAEFLRRLALSELFSEVTLRKTESVQEKRSGTSWIGFGLT